MRTGLFQRIPFHRFGGTAGRLASAVPSEPRLCGLGLAALIGLLVLTGCQHRMVEKRIATRERSLAWVAETLVEHEQAAPQRLQHSAEFVRSDMQWRRERLGRDVRWLGARLGYDLRRLQTRQPAYGEKLGEIFGGKPENIERTAIVLYF